MASKLFAPFKKIPQQLPIFKKSIDKCRDVSMSNFNSVYGMIDNVTCVAYDHNLDLLALGTKKGEIKIYGASGMVYTLVNSPLKPIKILKFLNNQGRLISIDNDNDMVLWEFQIENNYWDVTSSVCLSGQILNGKVTSLDISQPMSWRSDSDDLLELLIIGSDSNKICQVLVVGNRFNLYEGDDLAIDSEHLLTNCHGLEKDYDFGGVHQIFFNPLADDQLLVSFKNGLSLILETKAFKEAPVKEIPNDVINESPKDVVEEKEKESEDPIKIVDESENDKEKEPVINENTEDKTNQEEGEKEKVEVEQNEADKEKPVEVVKNEEVHKQENKKLKESTQVPYINVQRPTILNYLLNDKKISSMHWVKNNISLVNEESEGLTEYKLTGDGSKLEEPEKSITLPEPLNKSVSKFSSFDLNGENLAAFIAQESDKQNLLILMKCDKVYAEIETPSHIIDYIIAPYIVSDDEGPSDRCILLIICESQLIAVNVECENISEIQCPYLAFQNTSPITVLTGIVQVPSLKFTNSQTISEIFKNWPLNKTAESSEKADEDNMIDIIGTGHANGSICIWQVMNFGVLHLLVKVESSDLFNQPPNSSDFSVGLTTTRKKVGHQIQESEDEMLQITTMQLMLHSSDNFSNELLFCIVGNASGTALIFKYDGTDTKENLIKIVCDFDKEGINWIEAENPELLDQFEITNKLHKLSCIVILNPMLPITAVAFQPSWDLLAVGCTYGFVLVDLRHSKCLFSHLTIQRASKNNATSQPPLTVGQQLKKTIRQSFRKLKKLKPSAKHTYVVNEEKTKDKEENKQAEKEENKQETQKDTQPEADAEIVEDKPKEEVKDQAEENDNVAIVTNDAVAETAAETELITIEVSRKDRPISTVGSLLIVNTSLTSSTKIPCLFVGTNIGAIFAFEIFFEGGDDADDNVLVKLSKELHLQHKAPILLISVVNSNHVPLLKSSDQIGSYQRKFKNADEAKIEDEKPEEEINSESKLSEIEIGPSGDSDSKDELKQKSGTLPSPAVQEESVEAPVEGSRRSVDSSKDKITVNNANMKKSGTLPSSFLQAIGKTQGSSDSHELLVVSQEQVKLFSLPSLKAKYKYKVVDTGHHHFSHSKASNSQESEDKKDDSAKVTNETQSSKTVPRKISSVALCKILGLKLSGKKWNVTVALTSGEIIAVQINNLKKYLADVYSHSVTPILSCISSGELNLISSHTTDKWNIQITDFSQSITHRYEPNIAIPIPKTARPVIEEKTELAVSSVPDAVDGETTKPITSEEVIVNGHANEIVNGHHEVDEDEEKDQLGDETVVQNTSVVHHGDITMDSIKEYITNMDGNIIVKTIESTKEKQVIIDGIGQNATTIHETQVLGGEIIKDETTVHITSDTQECNQLPVVD